VATSSRALRLAAIVDLTDGSFILRPDPGQAHTLKLVVGGSAALALAAAVAFIVLTLGTRDISWPLRLAVLVLVATGDTFAWFTLKAPVLKADALEVRCVHPLYGRRMARSTVAFVFRGQYFLQGRGGGMFQKSYLFVASDGSVGVWCAASWFSDEGITEFAGRLGVPVRGDFSTRVRDRVDLKEKG